MTNELKKRNASKLRHRREELSMSRRRLSRLTKLSAANIGKLESGVGNPSLDTLQRIADATCTTFIIQPKRVDEKNHAVTVLS